MKKGNLKPNNYSLEARAVGLNDGVHQQKQYKDLPWLVKQNGQLRACKSRSEARKANDEIKAAKKSNIAETATA